MYVAMNSSELRKLADSMDRLDQHVMAADIFVPENEDGDRVHAWEGNEGVLVVGVLIEFQER